jgi:hypothetical protein
MRSCTRSKRAGRQAGAGRVGLHGLGGQAMPGRQLAGDGQQPRLDVQPDHPPAVADPGPQLGQDAEHAAADVDHARAGREAGAVEQAGGVGPEELGLGQQVVYLGRAVTKPVPWLRRRCGHVRWSFR